MKNKIFELVPERVQYDQFWIEIRKRNHWLIILRYGAVIMLTSLIIGIFFMEMIFPNFEIDKTPLMLIAFCIMVYNLFLHKIWTLIPLSHHSTKFNFIHLSLIQIGLDFISLMLLVYFTGSVESPMNAFIIFHVIIGSLLVPGIFITLIVTVALIISIIGSTLELKQIIPHHAIQGFLQIQLFNNPSYVIIFFSFLGITLYISIYLANSIATQLYQRERALTQAYADLETAEKSKSQYVISVVHDLKTPIVAAMTYLNMILDGNLGKIEEHQLKPLQRSKVRLTGAIDMIGDILHISTLKLESNKNNIIEVDLSGLCEEILKEMKVLLNSKKIEYNFIHDSNSQFIIKAEPKLLKLALSNLISNAYKYTEENGKIEVAIENIKDRIQISVADTGIGIPAQERDKIFQDFYRSTISKKLGIEGTGLGLSIVLQTIKQLNGEIKVESPSYLKSQDDKPGTQFIITLPKLSNQLIG